MYILNSYSSCRLVLWVWLRQFVNLVSCLDTAICTKTIYSTQLHNCNHCLDFFRFFLLLMLNIVGFYHSHGHQDNCKVLCLHTHDDKN